MTNINLDMGTFITSHDPDTKRFSAAFFSEDDLGAVIRCHFEVERAADHALEVITIGRWKRARAQYLSEKLNLLEVIGAPPRLLAPARTLNNLRNDFAHDGLERLEAQRELDLTRGLRSFFPAFTDEYSVEFHGSRSFTAKFRDCTTKQKYVVSSAILTMLIAGIPELMKAYQDEVSGRSSG